MRHHEDERGKGKQELSSLRDVRANVNILCLSLFLNCNTVACLHLEDFCCSIFTVY